MNAKDIAKALKCCYPPEVNNSCDGCPYEEETNCAERNFEYKAGEIIESLLARLDAAIAGQETLQKALAESQRRERAAVGDILCSDRCDVCKFQKDGVDECEKNDFDCENCQSEKCVCRTCRDEDKWQWRGPQEGEGNEKENNDRKEPTE